MGFDKKILCAFSEKYQLKQLRGYMYRVIDGKYSIPKVLFQLAGDEKQIEENIHQIKTMLKKYNGEVRWEIARAKFSLKNYVIMPKELIVFDDLEGGYLSNYAQNIIMCAIIDCEFFYKYIKKYFETNSSCL